MADQHCRVTVVGERRRVDLAVPARAPVGEYIVDVARICGVADDDAMPAAWSLGLRGMPTLAPGTSLADLGVADGQVLDLRDVTRGEYDEPTIFDVAEVVAEAIDQTKGVRWNVPARAMAMLSIGVLWLAAIPFGSTIGGSALAVLLPGLLALVAGLLLPVLAWTARRGQWQVGPTAQLVMALAAVPNLAGAMWLLGRDWFPPGAVPTVVAAGGAIGALVALIAMPGLVSVAVQILTVVALVVTVALDRLSANGLEVAAAVAVVGYGLLAAAPWATGHLAAFWPGADSPEQDPAEEARLTVTRGRRLLAGWNIGGAVVVGATLVVLATSSNVFAFALAGCLCVPLARRAGGQLLLLEALPTVLSACAVAFTVLIRLSSLWSGLPPTFGFTVTWLTGTAILVIGFTLMFRRDAEPMPALAALRIFATICVVASIPLLLGVFGVFGQLYSMGSQL